MSRYAAERNYRACIWCDRPFHVWRFQLKERNGGRYCSRPCYAAYLRAFSEALADGRLDSILGPERARAKAARLKLLQESAWL
jgi:hypothetical protein